MLTRPQNRLPSVSKLGMCFFKRYIVRQNDCSIIYFHSYYPPNFLNEEKLSLNISRFLFLTFFILPNGLNMRSAELESLRCQLSVEQF